MTLPPEMVTYKSESRIKMLLCDVTSSSITVKKENPTDTKMRNSEMSRKKSSVIKRNKDELERKKEAWRRYEMRLRRSNLGDSELDLDSY
jgi:hypothetical protein